MKERYIVSCKSCVNMVYSTLFDQVIMGVHSSVADRNHQFRLSTYCEIECNAAIRISNAFVSLDLFISSFDMFLGFARSNRMTSLAYFVLVVSLDLLLYRFDLFHVHPNRIISVLVLQRQILFTFAVLVFDHFNFTTNCFCLFGTVLINFHKFLR